MGIVRASRLCWGLPELGVLHRGPGRKRQALRDKLAVPQVGWMGGTGETHILQGSQGRQGHRWCLARQPCYAHNTLTLVSCAQAWEEEDGALWGQLILPFTSRPCKLTNHKETTTPLPGLGLQGSEYGEKPTTSGRKQAPRRGSGFGLQTASFPPASYLGCSRSQTENCLKKSGS